MKLTFGKKQEQVQEEPKPGEIWRHKSESNWYYLVVDTTKANSSLQEPLKGQKWAFVSIANPSPLILGVWEKDRLHKFEKVSDWSTIEFRD